MGKTHCGRSLGLELLLPESLSRLSYSISGNDEMFRNRPKAVFELNMRLGSDLVILKDLQL